MTIIFGEARRSHLEEIVALLHDDELGAKRESPVPDCTDDYLKAFNRIDTDPNAKLIIALDNLKVIAMAQLNLIQYLTYKGGRRAQIEGVRVHKAFRGQGIGHQLFKHLIQLAKEADCHLIQLTSDKQRTDALHFYESIGFKATHEGFKRHL